MKRNGILIASTSRNVGMVMAKLLQNAAEHCATAQWWFEEEEFGLAQGERELFATVRQTQPRLVVIDTTFDRGDITGLIYRLCDRYKLLHVVVFAIENCEARTAAALVSRGAESFLDIWGDERDLREGLRRVVRGEKFVPDQVESLTEKMAWLPGTGKEKGSEKKLTHQQLRVFRLTVQGKTKPEIAGMLKITVNTVKTHRRHIDQLCGGARLIDYIQYGLQHGILTAEELAGKHEEEGK